MSHPFSVTQDWFTPGYARKLYSSQLACSDRSNFRALATVGLDNSRKTWLACLGAKISEPVITQRSFEA